jgi:DNA repair exonuclease SbcCD ATPase subunit
LSDGNVSPVLSINAKNDITLEVSSQGGEYGISSSGERRMVDLSLQLALSRLSSRHSGFSCNLMILDEVEDKLDASARRKLVELLVTIANKENKTILIASHYKDIKSYVGKVWTVVKQDGISSLVFNS